MFVRVCNEFEDSVNELCKAVINRDMGYVKYLVYVHEINLNIGKASFGLAMAVSRGFSDMVACLTECGCDIVRNKGLMLRIARHNDDREMINTISNYN